MAVAEAPPRPAFVGIDSRTIVKPFWPGQSMMRFRGGGVVGDGEVVGVGAVVVGAGAVVSGAAVLVAPGGVATSVEPAELLPFESRIAASAPSAARTLGRRAP